MKNENDETQKQELPEQPSGLIDLIDFDSDEPLVCNRDQSGDVTCESCQ